jgi:hypothetical protein
MDASLPINDFEKNNLENPGASHRGQGNSAFADTDLGVSGPPEDTQTGHHQKNKSGSHASPCPYRGCLCRHRGGLSSLVAALSVVHQDALFQFGRMSYCDHGLFVQIPWRP